MNDQFEIIRKTRSFLLEVIKELSVEQLNKVPTGFNNNIIWNLGHLVAAQQGICYIRAGLKPWAEDAFMDAYKPGTKPNREVSTEHIEEVKKLLFSSIDMLENDYKKGLWPVYPAWTTRSGIEIKSIDRAIEFILFHEGLHSGYIMAMSKIV
jgi:hypothetical protein